MPNVLDGSVSIAIVLNYVYVATNGSTIFSCESLSDMSVMIDFFFFASFGRSHEAIFFLKAIEIGKVSFYFPELVVIDLGTQK